MYFVAGSMKEDKEDQKYLTGFKLLDFWDLRTSFLTGKSAR
jgi:hypothetical protein